MANLKTYQEDRLTLHHADCMEIMAQYPDKHFDLAVVDPPYGIGVNMNQGRRAGDHIKHDRKKWDTSEPKESYWLELCRVAKNKIIWGANNFPWIPPHNGYLFWDKDITGTVQFSKGELAYVSSLGHMEIVKIRAQSGSETYSDKIHPTQKPCKLYAWIYANYATAGMKILDTHLGSGSNAIAAHYAGMEFVGCELDADYYEAACKRVYHETRQQELF